MSSVLITGVAGFLGSHLARFYLEQGYFVTGLDNFSTGTKENIHWLSKISPDKFKFIEFDICNPWKDITPDITTIPKFIFHFASPASVPDYQKLSLETMWANSLGLKNAIDYADLNQARVIFSSTSEVYGSAQKSPQTETEWGFVNSFGERSCYDEAKRFGEALIYSANKKNKTQHGLIRIFNTYGPGMRRHDGRAIIQFMTQALENKDLTIYGDGSQTRSFCYIDDLINGINSYAQSDLSIPMNLGNDQEISIADLAALVIAETNSQSKVVFKNLPTDDPPQRKPDLTLAKSLLNYKYETNIKNGIQKMLSFYNQTRHSSRV